MNKKKVLFISVGLLCLFVLNLFVIDSNADIITIDDPCNFIMTDGTVLKGTAKAEEGVVVITHEDGTETSVKEKDIKEVVELVPTTRITRTGKKTSNIDSLLLKSFTPNKVVGFDVTAGIASTHGNHQSVSGFVEIHSQVSTDSWRLSNKLHGEYGGRDVDKKDSSYYFEEDDDIYKFHSITDVELLLNDKLFWYTRHYMSRDYYNGTDFNLFLVTGLGYYFYDTDTTKLAVRLGVGTQFKWFSNDCDDMGGILHGNVLFEHLITDRLLWHTELDMTYAIFSNHCQADDRLGIELRHDSYLLWQIREDWPLYIGLGIANSYYSEANKKMDDLNTTYYGKVTYRF